MLTLNHLKKQTNRKKQTPELGTDNRTCISKRMENLPRPCGNEQPSQIIKDPNLQSPKKTYFEQFFIFPWIF